MGISLIIQNYILRLYISMNDSFCMQVFQSQQDTHNDELSLLFIEFFVRQMIAQISSWKIVQQ